MKFEIPEERKERNLELNEKLAALLGWTEIQRGGEDQGVTIPKTWLIGLEKGADHSLGRDVIPMWCQSSDAAFRLMGELNIHTIYHEDVNCVVGVYPGSLKKKPVLTHSIPLETKLLDERYLAMREAVVHVAIELLTNA